ncbi:formin-like protein 20 [Sesamum indicum]|uniref:Formin-like protein 20 n=1 Tax=Sesamum indicum TaxID=4182 RepID=A0A6I9T3I2_SESIN|nr:formin-like protein 20 [Sesamum indicum]
MVPPAESKLEKLELQLEEGVSLTTSAKIEKDTLIRNIPPFLSHANQILRPNSVNVFLLFFAIVCGLFARRDDETSSSSVADDGRLNSGADLSVISSSFDGTRQSGSDWLEYSERNEYSNLVEESGGRGRLRRSSSSYPDFRQESSWESVGDRFRFVDDLEVNFRGSLPPDDFRRRARRSQEREKRAVETVFEEIHRSAPPDNVRPRGRRRSLEREKVEAETVVGEIHLSPPTDNLRRCGRRSYDRQKDEAAETLVEEIIVNKFEASSVPPQRPMQPDSSPPPPPPPPATFKQRRSIHRVPHKKNAERQKAEAEFSKMRSPPPPPAPPPPPPPRPPAATFEFTEHGSEKLQKKKSGATKEIATAIASLYKGQRKRKKKEKSRNIYDSATHNSFPTSVQEQPSPTPPPPPPPPPPSRVLQNLFKKSSKSKRIHSVSAVSTPPPPPPPPPPNSIFNNLFKTGSKSKRFQQTSTTAPPPPPPPPPPSSLLNSLFKNGSKSKRFKNVDAPTPAAAPSPAEPQPWREVNTGKPPKPTKRSTLHKETMVIAPPSPLISTPPPPPPPPFRMPEVKFVARGDFVRIRSAHSSRCSSPELEDFEIISVKSDGGDSMGPSISCSSPDVNAKADTFIARLRDEWRLEKINSVNEKHKTG